MARRPDVLKREKKKLLGAAQKKIRSELESQKVSTSFSLFTLINDY